MCAVLELNDTKMKPGKAVGVWLAERQPMWLIWAGFARKESLKRWLAMGGKLLDVPAHRFAERSDRTRQLAWDAVPAGLVVRGLVDPNDGKPLLKIVTRAATAEEFARFEHPRMPVLEAPLFHAEPIPLQRPEEPKPAAVQEEMFGDWS